MRGRSLGELSADIESIAPHYYDWDKIGELAVGFPEDMSRYLRPYKRITEVLNPREATARSGANFWLPDVPRTLKKKKKKKKKW